MLGPTCPSALQPWPSQRLAAREAARVSSRRGEHGGPSPGAGAPAFPGGQENVRPDRVTCELEYLHSFLKTSREYGCPQHGSRRRPVKTPAGPVLLSSVSTGAPVGLRDIPESPPGPGLGLLPPSRPLFSLGSWLPFGYWPHGPPNGGQVLSHAVPPPSPRRHLSGKASPRHRRLLPSLLPHLYQESPLLRRPAPRRALSHFGPRHRHR